MIPEIGYFSLILATLSAFLLALLPSIGLFKRQTNLMAMAWNFSYLVGIFSFIAVAVLAYSFATDDFSVAYVAAHSNSELPLVFKLAATWGGHEGSMLFWLFALALWLMIFAYFSRKMDPLIAVRTMVTLGLICLGLALFILFLSSPFERQFPVPLEGRDLNPMLQDVGLIFHPPLLYLGYVGFAVNFALTIGILLSGHFDAAAARWLRPWVLVSWLFLTLGIALGSWWAYYELGWGGWWFWDPVENASLMPWLLGLALLHSLSMTEQRGIFSYWTILFSLFAFAFSVLGTFIVRSGVLTSVHAFAVDGERGTALLLLFFLLTLCSLSIFAVKTQLRQSAVYFSIISRESLLLLFNILLTIATISVFLGTFYPIIFNAMHWGSISVGAPYFNSIFIPLLALVVIAMIGVLASQWQTLKAKLLIKPALLLLPACLFSYAMIAYQLQQESSLHFNFLAFILLSLGIWLVLANLCFDWRQLRLKRLAMVLAHSGVGIALIGAVMSSYFGSELGVRLAPNQMESLAGYQFSYKNFSNEIGPNFSAEVAHFEVSKNQHKIADLYPERRYYDVRTMNMSEVGIDWGFWGDIYIVIGDKFGNGEFSFRLHYKPFIRWLWFGGLMMAVGALLAMFSLKNKGNKK